MCGKREALLTVERLREALSYDPATGAFTWAAKISKKVRVGTEAGSRDKYGYLIIGLDGRKYLASRWEVVACVCHRFKGDRCPTTRRR